MDLLASFLLWLSVPQHGYALFFAASLSVYLVLAVRRGIREATAAQAAEAAALELSATALPEAGPAEPA